MSVVDRIRSAFDDETLRTGDRVKFRGGADFETFTIEMIYFDGKNFNKAQCRLSNGQTVHPSNLTRK